MDGALPSTWNARMYSRVLKDPFHVFHMFYISASHGLRVAFARALRDAIFILDPEDAARISRWAQSHGLTLDDIKTYRARWLWLHCKRIIPPPEQLYAAVAKVFRLYGPLKDASTGMPLFNTEAWKTAKRILKLIHDGYLSDPPGVALYQVMGTGSTNDLPVYRCLRGTNATEGGVHTHLRNHLPSSGMSIEHAQAYLMDYSLCHNLNVRGDMSHLSNKQQTHHHVHIDGNTKQHRKNVPWSLLNLDYQRDPAIYSRSQRPLQHDLYAGNGPMAKYSVLQAIVGGYWSSSHCLRNQGIVADIFA